VCENGLWCIRYNNEFYELLSEPDIVELIKTGRLQWGGQVIRMLEIIILKLTFLKSDRRRRFEIPITEKDRWNRG
jgi:hypothetical protein